MRIVLRIYLLIALIGPAAMENSFAQYDCKDYEKFNCSTSPDKRYKRNGQSRSAMIQVGMPTEMNLIIYRGQDYRISVCADEAVLGDVVFRLIELKRQLKQPKINSTDSTTLADSQGNYAGSIKGQQITGRVGSSSFETVREVIYDNSKDDMSRSIEFSATSTKRILLQVEARGNASGRRRTKGGEIPDIACLGILVEHMPTPSLGF